jgi:hypothetical protein
MRTYDLEPEEHLERLANYLECQAAELVAKLLARSCSNSAAAIMIRADALIRELRERAQVIAE